MIHGDTIYLAGQIADDHAASISLQTEEALRKVDEMLRRYGSFRGRILSATVWLKTMDDYAGMNAVWDARVDPDGAPARACVTSEMAHPGYLVEVMFTAAKI